MQRLYFKMHDYEQISHPPTSSHKIKRSATIDLLSNGSCVKGEPNAITRH